MQHRGAVERWRGTLS